MSLIKKLFHKPKAAPRQAIGRSLRGLSVGERLDLSLKLGRCDARLFAFGY